MCFFKLHVFDTIFTDPELGLFTVLFGEWREVPGVDLIFTNLDSVNILYFGYLWYKRKKWEINFT